MEKKKISKKEVNNMILLKEKQKAGVCILFISVMIMIIGAFTFGFSYYVDTSVSFEGLSASISDINNTNSDSGVVNVDTKKLFEDNYYNVLSILSNSVAFGTTWLDLCQANSVVIDNDTYVKVCSDDFNTRNDVVKYLSDYLTSDYIEMLLDDYYIDYEDSGTYALYIKPLNLNKDESYIDMDSYKVVSSTSNKIIYEVKSIYNDLNCKNNCQARYKSQKVTFVLENGNWLVDFMELPY